MTDEVLEKILSEHLIPEKTDKNTDGYIKARMALAAGKENHMKKFSLKKAVIIAAAACLAFGAVGIASTGIAYTMKSNALSRSTKFKDLAKIEERAGINVKAVENFKNGYNFEEMHVSVSKGFSEGGSVIKEYNGIDINYTKAGEDSLSLAMDSAEYINTSDERIPDGQKVIAGITVNYFVDTYKWVPEGYEITDEDRANIEKNNYYITVGSDEVSENEVCHVIWTQDGVSYDLCDVSGYKPAAEMFEMAEEIILSK